MLLKRHQAAILRRFPLVLILKAARPEAAVEPLRVKLDPGATTGGMALVRDRTGEVVWAGELTHRGQEIGHALAKRRAARRTRRGRKTRYHRRRPAGWLVPSVLSRVRDLLTWVHRLSRWGPVTALSLELAKFDTQALQNPTTSGIEYQQGSLAGYEIRSYLLEKWQRRCASCQQEASRVQVEHLVPQSRGGSDRLSNLVLAREARNTAEGTRTADEFGSPQLVEQAKLPLRGAAVMNATRWKLYRELQAAGLPVEVGTGGRTSYNRAIRRLPKRHWIRAALVGASTPGTLRLTQVRPWQVAATGHQRRQMRPTRETGFPRTRPKKQSRVTGFQTGDLVYALVPKGDRAAGSVGRVAVRARGCFNLTTKRGLLKDISYRYFRRLQAGDGYSYTPGGRDVLPTA
jgi:5-methylcytosine-specific restriction endonuclease McrA